MTWVVTHHAEIRMNEMNVDIEEVLAVLEWPSTTYPSPASYGPGRSVAVAGRLAVVHNPSSGAVITVLWNGQSGRSSIRSVAA